jgi:hypothetical protein
MEELARCEPSQPWTRADAEAWWSALRITAGPGAEVGPTVVAPRATTDIPVHDEMLNLVEPRG